MKNIEIGLRRQQISKPRKNSAQEKLRAAIAMGLVSGHGQAAEVVFKKLAAKDRKLV